MPSEQKQEPSIFDRQYRVRDPTENRFCNKSASVMNWQSDQNSELPHNQCPKLPTRFAILFVCTGNVCRSPAAKAVFGKHLRQNKIQSAWHVDSAGVDVDDIPTRPSIAMSWTAFCRGYRLGKRVRGVTRRDLCDFDLVIAMDRGNLSALAAVQLNTDSTVRLLSDFLSPGSPADVPDPMHRSRKICNQVFDMLESACPNIVAYVA